MILLPDGSLKIRRVEDPPAVPLGPGKVDAAAQAELIPLVEEVEARDIVAITCGLANSRPRPHPSLQLCGMIRESRYESFVYLDRAKS